MKIFLVVLFSSCCLFSSLSVSQARNGDDCLCITSETVKKYCEADNAGVPKTDLQVNQAAIARRDIQRAIDQGLEADLAKDAKARVHNDADVVTIKELDGKVSTYTKNNSSQLGASENNYQGILRVSDDTNIKIECLTLKGKEAIVYTNQHFVRYVPDRKDESPHELITNIVHRETWIFTEQGWKVKYIEELERGSTYLDRKLYTTNRSH